MSGKPEKPQTQKINGMIMKRRKKQLKTEGTGKLYNVYKQKENKEIKRHFFLKMQKGQHMRCIFEREKSANILQSPN